jgi:hypothetical protein
MISLMVWQDMSLLSTAAITWHDTKKIMVCLASPWGMRFREKSATPVISDLTHIQR